MFPGWGQRTAGIPRQFECQTTPMIQTADDGYSPQPHDPAPPYESADAQVQQQKQQQQQNQLQQEYQLQQQQVQKLQLQKQQQSGAYVRGMEWWNQQGPDDSGLVWTEQPPARHNYQPIVNEINAASSDDELLEPL